MTAVNVQEQELAPLPVASPDVVRAATAVTAGYEDPKSGKIAIGVQIVLPPLTPGGMDYVRALAEYFKRLGPAIVRGEVIILESDYVAGILAALNNAGVSPQAGWVEATITGQLALLGKILNGTLTAAELGELVIGLGARTRAVSIVKELRDRETAAEHLRNALQILATPMQDYHERGDDPAALWSVEQTGADIAAAVVRIHQALAQLEPARDLETPVDGTQERSLALVGSDELEPLGSALDVAEEDAL